MKTCESRTIESWSTFFSVGRGPMTGSVMVLVGHGCGPHTNTESRNICCRIFESVLCNVSAMMPLFSFFGTFMSSIRFCYPINNFGGCDEVGGVCSVWLVLSNPYRISVPDGWWA